MPTLQTLTPSTSRHLSSASSTRSRSPPSGPAPPSSSPTMTPTVGTITSTTSSTVLPPAPDSLNGAGICISQTAANNALPGVAPGTLHAQGRCGYGPRLPLLVISPWAKKNYLDTTVTDQSSVVRFIEDVFLSSQRLGGGSADATAGSIMNMFDFSNGAAPPNPNVVQLNPTTGLVTSGN